MREGVCSYYGFIGLYRYAGNLSQQARCLVNLVGIDFCVKAVKILARMQRHDNFLHGRVARPLADAVDRTFHLARPVCYAGQCIGHSQT